ncbi:MAG: branched-chain amino acid ABC transporter permease [Pseudomonadota bacterium]
MKNIVNSKYIALFFLILAVVFPLFPATSYYVYIASQICIWGAAATLLLLNIRTGLFNLGFSVFMAIGAYSTAILTTKHGISFWTSLPIGVVLAIVVAILIGVAIFRLKGMYFVLVTCALCEIMKLLLANFKDFTGGYNGLMNIPRPSFPFINFNNQTEYYYLLLVFLCIAVFATRRIWMSYVGKIFHGIEEQEILCRSIGIPTSKFKSISFAIAAFFAALCGSLLAALSSAVDPLMFGFDASVRCFLYAVLGGISSVFGPLIGTTVGMGINEAFSFALGLAPAILGVIIILIMLFMPKGLVGVIPARFFGADDTQPGQAEAKNGLKK